MEHFTNEKINTKLLPKFEEVPFEKLHPFYWKVLMINVAVFLLILGIGLGFLSYKIKEWIGYQMEISIAYVIFAVLMIFFLKLSFRKRAFAFRDHDVLYRHGIIATTTIVIPYNRIQHVALHESFVSRMFGLAKVQIFTAGGRTSDLEIPGIEKLEAENIKQLLMGKIQKQL